jgi:hypothetical protein
MQGEPLAWHAWHVCRFCAAVFAEPLLIAAIAYKEAAACTHCARKQLLTYCRTTAEQLPKRTIVLLC